MVKPFSERTGSPGAEFRCKRDPEFVEAWFNLGTVYCTMGDTVGARQCGEKLVLLNADLAEQLQEQLEEL